MQAGGSARVDVRQTGILDFMVLEDATALVNLGLIERTEKGELICPFSGIHVDMHLLHAA